MNKNDEPTKAELIELKKYLEESIAFQRKTQRTRKKAGLHNDWIDGKIDTGIKKDCHRLAFLDQVLESGVIK